MARKSITYTATDGRDKGKQFLLTEMPASQAEAWAIRALLAVGRAGIEVPEVFKQQGFAGLLTVLQDQTEESAEIRAALGVGLKFTVLVNMMRISAHEATPLLMEMMACCQRVESSIVRPLVEDDVEEIATRFKLRAAIWNLHADFFPGAGASTSASDRPAPSETTSTIKTSRRR